MSLISCSECGGQLSDRAYTCPSCGCPCNLSVNNRDGSIVERETPSNLSYAITGILVMLVLAGTSISGYYYQIFKNPLAPVFHSVWFYAHIPLGIISYSSIMSTLIVLIVASFNNFKIPKVVYALQLISTLFCVVCIVTGAIWAKTAWGSFWFWDVKETWSLIVVLVMFFCTTYLFLARPALQIALAVASIQFYSILISFIIVDMSGSMHQMWGPVITYNIFTIYKMLEYSSLGISVDYIAVIVSFLILLISAMLGLIPAVLAKRKGYEFFTWWLYGTCLFVVSVPHILLLASRETVQNKIDLTQPETLHVNKYSSSNLNGCIPVIPIGLYVTMAIFGFPAGTGLALGGYLGAKRLINKGEYDKARKHIRNNSLWCKIVLIPSIIVMVGTIAFMISTIR